MINIGPNWQVKPQGGQFGDIGLREDLPLLKKLFIVYIIKTEVRDLYLQLQTWLSTKQGMSFSNAMFHGNFKMAKAVEKKVARVFQLKDGWTICEDSITALTRGPLLSADGNRILVKSYGRITGFIRWIEGSPLLSLITFIVIVAAFISLIIRLIKLLP